MMIGNRQIPRRSLMAVAALTGLLALAAFTARATQASTVEWGHTSVNWLVGGKLLKSGERKSVAVQSSTPIKLQFEVTNVPFEVRCTSMDFKEATVIGGGTGQAIPRLNGCEMVQPEGCSVPSTITMNSLGLSLVEVPGHSYVKFSSATGYLFELPISNCAFAMGIPFKGSFAAQVEPAGVQKVLQPFAFNKENSEAVGGTFTALEGVVWVGIS